MTYIASPQRYSQMTYRKVGRFGLKLPAISLGLWQNFGSSTGLEQQRGILHAAFDAGVTHFDLANNYGPEPGAAEENFGRFLATDFAPYRDEMIISSKAGYVMNDSPYGRGGTRKYLMSSLDASLRRMGLDYVDIFYHHCPDPETPLDETMYALRDIVASGKALYVGVSSYGPELTAEAAAFMEDEGCPLLIHQPRYSMLDRWVEEPGVDRVNVLEQAADSGMGIIAFSPLAQGLLTDRYAEGIPEGSRAARGESLKASSIDADMRVRLATLRDIAGSRGQSLAQMALAWVLREQGDSTVTSALIGASSVAQLQENLAALDHLGFSEGELAAIDEALQQ